MRQGSFLIVTWGGGGNVPPALGLAAKLAHRGHHVRFLASGELETRVTDAGFAFRAFERVHPPGEGSVEDQMADFVRILTGDDAARDASAEIDREPTDVLVVDCMQLNALTAAELSGLPTAVFVHLLYEPWRMRPGFGEMVRSFIDETRRRLGAEALTQDLVIGQLWDRHALALVVTPHEFDFPTPALPANVRYVGPIFEAHSSGPVELPWPDDDNGPLVLVGFSSTYMHQEDALRRAAEGVASSGARCLVTVGEAIDPATVAPSDRVVVRQWVPHRAVLTRTSAVVTHAGHATVMAALAHGVPLVCMPMGRDQFQNAERVSALGAGRTISMDASAPEICEAVGNVLEDASYRAAAGEIAATIARYGDGERAIAELEALL